MALGSGRGYRLPLEAPTSSMATIGPVMTMAAAMPGDSSPSPPSPPPYLVLTTELTVPTVVFQQACIWRPDMTTEVQTSLWKITDQPLEC